ncbi:hypothetical protein SELMODRAFT_426176 [Selaginella moellendorffii]|uniref:Uncharacterized protein n=1 Tax=Selaginella moellendorffii TaxID=88036 RepID=D8SVL0_SELML|nr:hypothetical protein SELMODRAFT_426176 [Selaginella moellendorffii]
MIRNDQAQRGIAIACQAPLVERVRERRDAPPHGLQFIRGRIVVLVSHELTLTGVLSAHGARCASQNAGATVQWITIEKKEKRLSAQREVDRFYAPKVLWWIPGHYFTLNYVNVCPRLLVAAVMIDSHAMAEYWTNRTQQHLGIKIPKVHLGNSKHLTEAALVICSVSMYFQRRRPGPLSQGRPKTLGSSAGIYAVTVGSDWIRQPKFEAELRELVEKNIAERVATNVFFLQTFKLFDLDQ